MPEYQYSVVIMHPNVTWLAAYRNVAAGDVRFEAQVINGLKLKRGNFGSAMWARVAYQGPHKIIVE